MPAPIPMPIHVMTDHPAMRTLPNAAWHIVAAILHAYWLSECRPLPTGNNNLAVIGRTDVATYRRHYVVITSALEAMCPVFGHAFEQETTKRRVRIERATKAGRIGTIARWHPEASGVATPPTPKRPVDGLQTASSAAQYKGTGKHDKAARDASKARHEGVLREQAGSNAVLLKDTALAQPSETIDPNALGPWTWQPTPTPPPDLTDDT